MKRIDLIASLASGSNTICDIGCDHAYTVIKAIKDYGVSYAIASDINDGPLEIAKKNIAEKNMENKVKIIKSDGFKNIDLDFDTAIISGMGGNLIIDILSNSLDKIKNKKLIISANSDFYLVRKYLNNNGFIITDEHSIVDDNKYYEVAVFIPGDIKYASFELKYGPILLKKKEECFINEYKKRLKKLEEFLPTIKDTIQKDEKLVLRNDYFKIILGDSTKMIPILDSDNYYREYFIDDKNRPLIVISAGGGYKYTSPRESEPVARFYNEHGFHSVIVNYREDLIKYPHPQKSLAYVINLYKNDKRVSKVIGLGFSAGGHNILEVALHPEAYDNVKIDYLILGYPVITSNPKYWHKGSFLNLLNEDFSDEKLLNRLSLENEVTAKAPELFLWSTFTDESVPLMNSLLLVEAYKKANVNCEYHMYPMGGHGLSLANSESSGGDKNKEIDYIAKWALNSIDWINMKLKLNENNSQ